MRYDAWVKENQHVREADRKLHMVSQKVYALDRRLMPQFRTGQHQMVQFDVRLSVYHSGHPEDTGQLSMCVDRTGYGTIQNPFSELTPTDLIRLSQIRETVDQWMAGKLDALPDHMPWEKLLPPWPGEVSRSGEVS